jgi:hypothetical protein
MTACSASLRKLAGTHAAVSKGCDIRCTRTSSQDLPMGALNTNYLIQSISEVMM